MTDTSKQAQTTDIYRDSPIRYCGYANEVGESFRPIVPKKIVNLSYAVSIAYVFADCFDKTSKTYQKPKALGGGEIVPAAKIAGDVFLWQMLASVGIPGLVINRITWAAQWTLNKAKMPGIARKVIPTCLGLAVIPFIIHPIDKAVDHVMDETYRKYV